MKGKTEGQRLDRMLQRNHRAEMSDTDRHQVEQMLGPGAVRYQLDRAGKKLLLRSLAKDLRDRER